MSGRVVPAARADRGSVTVLMLVVPLVLLLLCGISLDLWAALSARGRIAAIADQAAVSGAGAITLEEVRIGTGSVTLDPDAAVRRAIASVDTHPDAGMVTARTASAAADRVSVTVEGRSPFLLLRLIGVEDAEVRVTGHATPVTLD